MALEKNEFVALCIKYQHYKKVENIRKAKMNEAIIIDYSMNNHFRIARRLRGTR